jgi:hypothetical protein
MTNKRQFQSFLPSPHNRDSRLAVYQNLILASIILLTCTVSWRKSLGFNYTLTSIVDALYVLLGVMTCIFWSYKKKSLVALTYLMVFVLVSIFSLSRMLPSLISGGESLVLRVLGLVPLFFALLCLPLSAYFKFHRNVFRKEAFLLFLLAAYLFVYFINLFIGRSFF